jgi:phage terminase small subunit
MNNHVDNYRLTEVTVAIPPTHYYIKDIMKQVKNNKKLTHKQEVFVKHLIDNPKASATEAALTAYNTNYNAARAIASENLTKPSIVSALSNYNNLIENTLINTVNDYGNSDKIAERALAVDTSKYIHDKIHGKATQKIEQQSTSVNISIDLTQTED